MILNLFPTPVYVFDVLDPCSLNAALLAATFETKKTHTSVVHRSNPLGWHSDNQIFMSDAKLENVRKTITDLASLFANQIGYKFKIRMSNCWISVSPPGAGNDRHNHPGSLISGVYYIKAASGSSSLTVHDPRPAKVFCNPYETKKESAWLADSIPCTVQTGRVILFPGWLDHSVSINQSENDRIIFSFNFTYG